MADDDKHVPADGEESLDELRERRSSNPTEIDPDEDDESVYDLPGDDEVVEGDVDTVRVLPKQADEFICERCFLVHHASRRYQDTNLCKDCA